MKAQFVILLSTLLSSSVWAALPDAIKAFDEGRYDAAYPEFMALSEEGDPVASFYTGRMLNEGLGIDADSTQAISYFQRADKENYPEAAVQLGLMALNGEGMEKNQALGVEYLKKAAYAGNANALYELGNVYTDGKGVDPNLTYAFGFYYMSALKGDKRAQVKTAKHYLSGRGIPQDFNKAYKWYIRAANQGYVPAQLEWAQLRTTNSRLINFLDAYSWYSILAAYNSDDIGREAARKRDAIGRRFNNSVIAAQQQKVMKWRPTPANRTVPPDEVKNAVLPIIPGFNDADTTKTRLESGETLTADGAVYGISADLINTAVKSQDKTELEKAITKAVDKGLVKAYGYYGDILRTRFNDAPAAFTWYQKGAEANDSYAQYQLGKSYCEGRGIPAPDVGLCYGWLLTANKKTTPNMKLTIKNAIKSVEEAAKPEELQKGKDFVAEREQKLATDKQQKPATDGSSLFNLF